MVRQVLVCHGAVTAERYRNYFGHPLLCQLFMQLIIGYVIIKTIIKTCQALAITCLQNLTVLAMS